MEALKRLCSWLWLAIPIGFGNYLYKTITSETPESNYITWITVLAIVASKLFGYAIDDYYTASRANSAFLGVFMQSFSFGAILLGASFTDADAETVVKIIVGAIALCVLITMFRIHRTNMEELAEEEEYDEEYEEE